MAEQSFCRARGVACWRAREMIATLVGPEGDLRVDFVELAPGRKHSGDRPGGMEAGGPGLRVAGGS